MSNICEICGGIQSMVYLVEALPKATIPVAANFPFKVCMGHPKGAPKHDGKLDDYSHSQKWRHATVSRAEGYGGNCIYLEGGYGDIESGGIILDAKQAISLLSWLLEKKPELTALAEQEQE